MAKSAVRTEGVRNPQSEIGWLGWFGDGGEQAHQRGAGLRRVVLGLCLAMVLWLAGASGGAETRVGAEIYQGIVAVVKFID